MSKNGGLLRRPRRPRPSTRNALAVVQTEATPHLVGAGLALRDEVVVVHEWIRERAPPTRPLITLFGVDVHRHGRECQLFGIQVVDRKGVEHKIDRIHSRSQGRREREGRWNGRRRNSRQPAEQTVEKENTHKTQLSQRDPN